MSLVIFLRSVVGEFKGLSFPSKSEIYTNTIIVLVVAVLSSLLVAVVDILVSSVVGFVLGA